MVKPGVLLILIPSLMIQIIQPTVIPEKRAPKQLTLKPAEVRSEKNHSLNTDTSDDFLPAFLLNNGDKTRLMEGADNEDGGSQIEISENYTKELFSLPSSIYNAMKTLGFKPDQIHLAKRLRHNSHVENGVKVGDLRARQQRDITCNNRYTGDCQSLETSSICPWRYTLDFNGPHDVECLTCKPTTGCDDNCLLTCQPWYVDGRAVACIAALPCTHSAQG